MLLSELVAEVNALADENESLPKVTGFINDAIAKINVRLKSAFPYMNSSVDLEFPFPEEYQRTVLIPFAVGRIKQMDSSQFEYSDAYGEFMEGLNDMAATYIVPELYKKPTDEIATSDIYTTPPTPWGWRW